MDNNYGCAVLAGGAGKRMGNANKAAIEYNGRSFLDCIGTQLEQTGLNCYLSAANYEQTAPCGWTIVRDAVTSAEGEYIGPMGGIYSCLVQAEKDGLEGLFFAPCDAPLYSSEIIIKIVGYIDADTDAVCWRTGDGRVQTTFGWYSVRCIDAFGEDIFSGKYKLLRSLDKVTCKIIDTVDSEMPDTWFMNINCAADYHKLIEIPAFATAG